MNRFLAVLAVVAMAVTIPTIGSATPTDCSTLSVPFSGTVNGGLTVSDSDNCQLDGATIHGGIDMTNGSLLVCNHSTIDGGINATGGSSVEVGGADDGLPLSGPCLGNLINGHVTVSGVTGVEFDTNTMNGGADLNNNGPVEVEGNDIQGPLNCSGNTSVTNDGQPNSVTGPETGQCAGL
jgi:hexosaminidase